MGPDRSDALAILQTESKENSLADKEFLGALRHKDPSLCAVGAVAFTMLERWPKRGKRSPLNFKTKQAWCVMDLSGVLYFTFATS
jgi:hypothetical protein